MKKHSNKVKVSEIEVLRTRIEQEGMDEQLVSAYLDKVEELAREKKLDYVSIDQGLAGYFAVYMIYDEEVEDYIPWETGCGRSKDKKRALVEAFMWTQAEGLEDEAVCA